MAHRVEFVRYTKADLEAIICTTARVALIGRMYVGDIHGQECRWTEDGGIEVFTTHAPTPMVRA